MFNKLLDRGPLILIFLKVFALLWSTLVNKEYAPAREGHVVQLMYPEIPENYNMDDFKKAYHEAFSQFTMQHHNK